MFKAGRKLDFSGTFTLRGEPGFAAREFGQLRDDDPEVGPGLRVVEPQQQIAGFDQFAVPDQDRADDATGLMLDLLQARFDDD